MVRCSSPRTPPTTTEGISTWNISLALTPMRWGDLSVAITHSRVACGRERRRVAGGTVAGPRPTEGGGRGWYISEGKWQSSGSYFY